MAQKESVWLLILLLVLLVEPVRDVVFYSLTSMNEWFLIALVALVWFLWKN
ncbi:MAG TPA: hypothetical protein VJI71_02060 [Candidatus Norongarragalinales archaeon]|nr:hypothetical protein [Candidatus Norongarragalinales archaeon]